jgi:hypothetical protein
VQPGRPSCHHRPVPSPNRVDAVIGVALERVVWDCGCPDIYFCAQASAVECARHGGFSQCCDRPADHVALRDQVSAIVAATLPSPLAGDRTRFDALYARWRSVPAPAGDGRSDSLVDVRDDLLLTQVYVLGPVSNFVEHGVIAMPSAMRVRQILADPRRRAQAVASADSGADRADAAELDAYVQWLDDLWDAYLAATGQNHITDAS